MRRIFLDTVGLLALWNARDQWHPAATKAFAGLVAEGADLYTSSYVLLECGNAAARAPFRRDVVQLRQHLTEASRVIEPTAEDCTAAWATYSDGDATGPGIVDEISFAVMRRLQLTDAFTNDRHFRAAGFNPLF